MLDFRFYQKAYRKLGKASPLRFDCGELCGKGCCQGSENGMVLFPGEEAYLGLFEHDYDILETTYSFKLLKCNASCDRSIRPLACMMFPLFPFLYEDGTLLVDFDPRARGICPLLFQDMEELALEPGFHRGILRFFRKAVKQREIREFLLFFTAELDALKKFTE
ncbi:MAG: hypothetical protein R6W96_02410 [Clostridia bacterium]